MGKSSGTNQSNVPKKLPNYRADQKSDGAGTGVSGSGSSSANACLITFREKLSFLEDAADLIVVGFQFTLVPNDQGDLEIVSSGRIVGQYTGSKLTLLKRCISSDYIYRGTVQAINQDGADCEITGFGVSNGTDATV